MEIRIPMTKQMVVFHFYVNDLESKYLHDPHHLRFQVDPFACLFCVGGFRGAQPVELQSPTRAKSDEL